MPATVFEPEVSESSPIEKRAALFIDAPRRIFAMAVSRLSQQFSRFGDIRRVAFVSQ